MAPSPEGSLQETRPAALGEPLVIDIHTHLAGMGAGGSGCHVSARMKRSPVYHFMKWKFGLDPVDPASDERYVEKLAGDLDASEHVDCAVVFAMDGVYDEAGKRVPERSHLYVPNEHLFDVCRKRPRLLPGASVNPMRADAAEELARADESGAVLIKWLAPLQRFDPADRKVDAFYEELARRELPLLAHAGCEHTFPEMLHEMGHAARYRRALEVGATVILAHCGTACFLHRSHDQTEEILRMMRVYPNLYADTSALASPLKFTRLKKVPFADFPGRFLHGSDYPIPTLPLPFARDLGLARALAMTLSGSPFETDWQIKTAAGQPADVFTNASRLLAERIARWRGLCPR